jgi:hypothetical protein
MSLPVIIFPALGAVLLTPYLFLRYKRRLLPGLFLKVGVSMLFLMTAAAGIIAAGGETQLPLSMAVFIGLCFGLLGDIFLDQKDMYAEHKDTYTFAGFIAFMTGHFFFIAGMLFTYCPGWKTLLPGAAAGLAVGFGCLLMAKPMKMDFGRFKLITVIYGFVLAFMVSTAFACYAVNKEMQPLWMGIGGISFLLSDLILSQTYFGKGHHKPLDYILNYVLYYGAQFAIALSLSLM